MSGRLESLQWILADLTGKNPDEITTDTDVFDPETGVHSIIAVQLISRLETEYGFDVPDEELDIRLFQSPGSILRYLAEKLGEEEA